MLSTYFGYFIYCFLITSSYLESKIFIPFYQKQKGSFATEGKYRIRSSSKGATAGRGIPFLFFYQLEAKNGVKMAFIWEKKPTELLRCYPLYMGHIGGYITGSIAKGRYIVGDFMLSLGENMVYGNGYYPIGLSQCTMVMGHPYATLTTYCGRQRKQAFRGVAYEYERENGKKIILWISKKRLDAARYQKEKQSYVQTVRQRAIIVRSYKDFERINQVNEYGAGGCLAHESKHAMYGLSLLSLCYDQQVQPRHTYYSRSLPPYRMRTNGSIWGRWNYKSSWWFTEWALTALPYSIGGIIGWLWSFHKKGDLLLLYRCYGPQLDTPYGAAISKNSQSYNEQALRIAFNWQANSHQRYYGYVEQGKHAAPSFRCHKAAHFGSIKMGCTHTPSASGSYWKNKIAIRWQPRNQVGSHIDTPQLSMHRQFSYTTLYRHTFSSFQNYYSLAWQIKLIHPFLQRAVGSTFLLRAAYTYLLHKYKAALILYSADYATANYLYLPKITGKGAHQSIQGEGGKIVLSWEVKNEEGIKIEIGITLGIHRSLSQSNSSSSWQQVIAFHCFFNW